MAVVFNDSVVHDIAMAAVPDTGLNTSSISIPQQPALDPSTLASAALAAALLQPLQLGESYLQQLSSVLFNVNTGRLT